MKENFLKMPGGEITLRDSSSWKDKNTGEQKLGGPTILISMGNKFFSFRPDQLKDLMIFCQSNEQMIAFFEKYC